MLTRRHVLASALAAPAILHFGTGTARAATTLKISHQFPGGTIDKGDFRDRLCRMFAQEVAKRKAAWKPHVKESQTPWQELQRKFIGQLASGACLDFAVNYQKIAATKGVPRHSH